MEIIAWDKGFECGINYQVNTAIFFLLVFVGYLYYYSKKVPLFLLRGGINLLQEYSFKITHLPYHLFSWNLMVVISH